METTMIGFALGIVTFVFALMSVGVVWAVIKIKDVDESLRYLERDLNDASDENKRDVLRSLDNVYDTVNAYNSGLEGRIDNIERELDSRFDKMYNKLTNIEILKK